MRKLILCKALYSLGFYFVVCALAANSQAVVIYSENNPAQGENDGIQLGEMQIFNFGGWEFDDTAAAGTTEINNFTQFSAGGDFSGAGIAIHIDASSANPDFNGNPLQDGEVLRLSMWMASDPALPISVGETIIDVLKFEFWNTALGNPDVNPEQRNFDTEQQGGLFTPFVDTLSTTEWTQYVFEYEVDDFDVDVASVVEIRPVMFIGDFAGAGDQSGSMFVDGIIVERFANQAAADASPVDTTNPGALIPPAAGLTADFDMDTDVDVDDLNALTTAYGVNDGGDTNADLDTDGHDFLTYQLEYTGPAAQGAVRAVPEPSTVMLVMCSSLCFAGSTRRARN